MGCPLSVRFVKLKIESVKLKVAVCAKRTINKLPTVTP